MKNTGNTDSLDKRLIGFKILKKESNYMKKVIILIVLAMATIRCTELAELNDEEERIREAELRIADIWINNYKLYKKRRL